MPESTTRWQAASLVIAPVVMAAGLLYHPHIGNPVDDDFLARLATAVLANPTRWAVAHLAVAVGSGLLVLAFIAMRALLREAGEERWSARGLPFIVMGSTFYALLPAMEFAPLAAAGAGADVEMVSATQGALLRWFAPTLFTSAIVFAAGAGLFAAGIARSGVLGTRQTRLVVAALLVTAASRFVPLIVIQLHVQAVAGIIALWPVAYAIRTRSEASVRAHTRAVA